MKTSDFDYTLPEELIAQEPLEDRSASRMLWVHRNREALEHRAFRDLTDILEPGDLLVMNDTRVTARRLMGQRPTGARVEALLLRETSEGIEALTRPAQKLKPGSEIWFDGGETATVVSDLGNGLKTLAFKNPREIMQSSGMIPLPPYFHGKLATEERYQTVYGTAGGSAAAPTAGLHFTPKLLQSLRSLGVKTATVTLNVGLDTFRPVSSELVEEHVIHGESCTVPSETVQAVSECEGRIIPVGTTTTRTLETFAVGPRRLEPGSSVSRIFITPGFEFKIADGILTNFHMPRTTMLFMLSAFIGRDRLLESYRVAVSERYRFLSFGDSMLIL